MTVNLQLRNAVQAVAGAVKFYHGRREVLEWFAAFASDRKLAAELAERISIAHLSDFSTWNGHAQVILETIWSNAPSRIRSLGIPIVPSDYQLRVRFEASSELHFEFHTMERFLGFAKLNAGRPILASELKALCVTEEVAV